MRVAFYAPLKPPGHPIPSGDRHIARLFLEALRRAGHQMFATSGRIADCYGNWPVGTRVDYGSAANDHDPFATGIKMPGIVTLNEPSPP